MITQMVQAAVEHSSITLTELQILIALPGLKPTSARNHDMSLLLTMMSTSMRTSQARDPCEEIAAHVEFGEVSLQLILTQRAPLTPTFTTNVQPFSASSSLPTTPRSKSASMPWRADQTDGVKSGQLSTSVFWCAPGIRADVAWKERDSVILNVSLSDIFVQASHSFLVACAHTIDEIEAERSRSSPAPPQETLDFRSPDSCRTGVDEPSTPIANIEKPGWPWLKAAFMRLSRLYGEMDDEMSSSGTSSVWGSSPGGTEGDFISMHSYFNFAQEEDDEDDDLETRSGGLSVDRLDKRVLNKLLQSTDEVKSYLLSELRKEEAESSSESRLFKIILSPLSSLMRCLKPAGSMNERRTAFLELMQRSISINIGVSSMTAFIDPSDTAQLIEQDSSLYVRPSQPGRVVSIALYGMSLRADKDITVSIKDARAQLIEAQQGSESRSCILIPEQIFATSMQTLNLPDYWIGTTQTSHVEQMYALLAYPRPASSDTPLISLLIEGPKIYSDLSGKEGDSDMVFNLSISPVTCCLSSKLKSMFKPLQSMLHLFDYKKPHLPSEEQGEAFDFAPPTSSRKSEGRPSSKHSEATIDAAEAQPSVTLRIFAECLRIIAVQPEDQRAVVGMLSLENLSVYQLRDSVSFATDCLIGIGEASPKHLCLVPMVLTKDPLWFCFDPDVYFDEKSQVFQLTELPVADRPTATATLMDTPLPSIQIEWRDEAWHEPETGIQDTQSSFPDVTPSVVGLSPYLVVDGKRASTSMYPPSLTSLLRRNQKATSSSMVSIPKDRRDLIIRILAVIFSWPRSFVVGWLTALHPLVELQNANLGNDKAGVPESSEEASPIEAVAQTNCQLTPTPHAPWHESLWDGLASRLEINASIDKVIAHYIPKDPFTMAAAVTVNSTSLVCDFSESTKKVQLSIQDLTTSIYLFNQFLQQWVQHKSCLTKRQCDYPALKAQVSISSNCKLRLELRNILGEVNESLLLLALLIYKELHSSTSDPPSELAIDLVHVSIPSRQSETPCVKEKKPFSPAPTSLREWWSNMEGSLSLEVHDVIVSFTSDTVLQTIPVVLDLLRSGDVSSWPLPGTLMWGYELQTQRFSLQLDFKGYQMTRLRESLLNMALALRETGTISITKALDDNEGAIEVRRHGLFTVADYGPGRDQLSSAIEVINIKNLDLRFLEMLLFPRTEESGHLDTIKMETLHMSLSSSTIATLSRSFSQIKDLLNLPIDTKHTMEDLLLYYFQQRSSAKQANHSSAFYTPGLIPESHEAKSIQEAQSPSGVPTPTAIDEANRNDDEDDVWEVDEYYNDLIAELGVSETWKESVIAAKPTPGPIWVPDFQIEVKSFICDLRAISMIDSCIISLRADHIVFTLSYVKEDCHAFAPHRKASFECQSYHIRDTTHQSHYEFVCQPYRPPELRTLRQQKAISVELEAYRLDSSSSKELSSHTLSGNSSADYLMIPSEPSSASSITPAVRPPAPLPKMLVEHSLNIALSPMWITLDMKTLSAINDFVETLEGLKKLQETSQPATAVPTMEGLLQQELLGGETYINAVSTITFLLLQSGVWNSCVALAACIEDSHNGICETPGPAELQSTPLPQHRLTSEAASFSGAPEESPPAIPNSPILIRSFESQELLVRFDFHSEGLDHQRLRQGGLIAALNFLAQFCTIEGLEVTFKRLKLEGLMTPKELMVRIVASSVADFDRSQVLQYAVRGTPVLRSLWDISASLKSLMNDALDQSESKPTVAMEVAALRQLRQVFDSSEWSVETPPSPSKATSPKAAEFTDALESFDYNERVEMILQITRRSFLWVEDQALLSLKTLAGQASGSLPFAVRLAEHSGDFLKCLLVESLKISERLMSTCSRRIAAIDTSVTQHLCLSSRLLKRRVSMGESPAKTTGDTGSPRWSFVERGAAGFYEPRTAREGLQDAVVHLRRGWEQAYSIAEQIDFSRRNPWSVRGGDIMAENRAMLMSVVSLEALQAVGRVLPVLLLKPIVTLAEAISSALQGTRNQVDPRQHFERTRSLRAPRVSGEELLR